MQLPEVVYLSLPGLAHCQTDPNCVLSSQAGVTMYAIKVLPWDLYKCSTPKAHFLTSLSHYSAVSNTALHQNEMATAMLEFVLTIQAVTHDGSMYWHSVPVEFKSKMMSVHCFARLFWRKVPSKVQAFSACICRSQVIVLVRLNCVVSWNSAATQDDFYTFQERVGRTTELSLATVSIQVQYGTNPVSGRLPCTSELHCFPGGVLH